MKAKFVNEVLKSDDDWANQEIEKQQGERLILKPITLDEILDSGEIEGKVGTLNATYAEIVNTIGFEPNANPMSDKSQIIWAFVTVAPENEFYMGGNYAMISEWKEIIDGVAKEDITEWSIHGEWDTVNFMFPGKVEFEYN
jgi:hypothetical protein